MAQLLTPTITHALNTPASPRNSNHAAMPCSTPAAAVTVAVASRLASTRRRGRVARRAAVKAPSR